MPQSDDISMPNVRVRRVGAARREAWYGEASVGGAEEKAQYDYVCMYVP